MSRLLLLAAAGYIAASSVSYAEESCKASGPMMTKEAITKSLQDRGYAQIRDLSLHNGCYEAKGIDSKGHRFELELNGSTGAIVKEE